MTAYLPQTPGDLKAMLQVVGAASTDELFASLPQGLRLSRPLDLPAGLSEMEVAAEMARLAARNAPATGLDSYLGGGAYERYIPSVVGALAGRSEFFTAYTPYQPELTQGMLQATYEYQSMVCLLTGLPLSNASLYEGGHALAEAALMACAATGRKRLVLAAGIHPEQRQVLATYGAAQGVELKSAPVSASGATDLAVLKELVDGQTAAVLMANPNFYGGLEDGAAMAGLAHAQGALLVAAVDPVSLALLAPPGETGADIACGEGQGLGVPLSFGGPYLGFLACRKELLRRMPSRLVGRTHDHRGQQGFVLTLQTREQHIRREKATSNICTNQALMALRALIYLAALGPRGLAEAANLSLQNSHYLAGRLAQTPGVAPAFSGPYFCEFTLRLPAPAERVAKALRQEGILAGLPLSRFEAGRADQLLVCATEMKTRAQLDHYAQALPAALAKAKEAQ
jgi:glycine dehydrogenase subunit 1